jgi:DNA-binding NarL/FixJ family response regulator
MHNTALIIDDHPLITRGMAEFLRSNCQFSGVTCVTNEEDFWTSLSANTPDIVIVDFWLPKGAALPLLAEFREKYPKIPTLVISADNDPLVIEKIRAMKINGFILKQEDPNTFATAVNEILKGESWFHQIRQPLGIKKEIMISCEELGLTNRQGEVLTMILDGQPNKRIAQKLGVTEATVKEHITSILSQLGVSNRVEAITKLRDKKLIIKPLT